MPAVKGIYSVCTPENYSLGGCGTGKYLVDFLFIRTAPIPSDSEHPEGETSGNSPAITFSPWHNMN